MKNEEVVLIRVSLTLDKDGFMWTRWVYKGVKTKLVYKIKSVDDDYGDNPVKHLKHEYLMKFERMDCDPIYRYVHRVWCLPADEESVKPLLMKRLLDDVREVQKRCNVIFSHLPPVES